MRIRRFRRLTQIRDFSIDGFAILSKISGKEQGNDPRKKAHGRKMVTQDVSDPDTYAIIGAAMVVHRISRLVLNLRESAKSADV